MPINKIENSNSISDNEMEFFDDEEWKAIPGYEGLYEVSNYGRVKSLPRYTTKGKIIKPYISNANGYVYVCLSNINLSNKSKRISKRVHVLVMEAFCPVSKHKGYDSEYTIDHIDGDKTNNKLSNLEWCSQKENQKRAYKLGLQVAPNRKKVIDLDTLEVFDTLTEAAHSIGITKAGAITRVCRGIRSNIHNHRFAYYDDYLNNTIPEFKGRYRRKGKVCQ